MGKSQEYAQQGETYRLMATNCQTPSEPQMVFQRAQELLKEALQAFNLAIDSNEKYAWAYAHRGATYRLLGSMTNFIPQAEENYGKADEDFKKAIELNSKYAWAYAQQGENYCCWALDLVDLKGSYVEKVKENLKTAIKAFDKAIEINQNYAWAYAHRGMAYRFCGHGLIRVGDDCISSEQPNFDRAIADLEKAIKLNKKYAWAYAYKATVHREKAFAYKYKQDDKGESDANLIQKEQEQWKLAFDNVQKAISIFPGIFDKPLLRHNSVLFNYEYSEEIGTEMPETRLFLFQPPPLTSGFQDNMPNKYELYARAISKVYTQGVDAAQEEIKAARDAYSQ
ncbi:MAG: hypothetical protein WBV73_16140 [Phormidium sp.]